MRQPRDPGPPITRLPFEVLRETILHLADSKNQPRTISLSHVSSVWRAVTASCTLLFVEADWDEWPDWLIELWCTRAKGGSLRVMLGWKAMIRLSDALDDERREEDGDSDSFLATLDRTRSSWALLSAHCSNTCCSMDRKSHQRRDQFLLDKIPQLEILSYSNCAYAIDQPVRITTPLPELRELEVAGIASSPLACYPNLSVITVPLADLVFNDLSNLSWGAFLSELPPSSTLKELRISDLWIDISDWPPNIPISLPSIEILKIQSLNASLRLTSLFLSSRIPNLRSLTLPHFPDNEEIFVALLPGCLQALVRSPLCFLHSSSTQLMRCQQTLAAPVLTSLVLHQMPEHFTASRAAYVFMRALLEPSILPHLDSLVVTSGGTFDELDMEAKYVLSSENDFGSTASLFVESRKMKKLYLPALSTGWMKKLAPSVELLEVCLGFAFHSVHSGLLPTNF